MAWNQSGKNSPGGWGGKRSGPLPPGLDELLKKLNDFFGGGGGGIGLRRLAGWLCGLLLVLWAMLGFYRVDASEQAAVFRFGQLLTLHDAGLYWNPPLVDVVRRIDHAHVEQAAVVAPVLTADENILAASLQVEYRIADARAYLLHAGDPESLLVHAAESALHRVAAAFSMDELVGAGHARLAGEVQRRLQADLDRYRTGLAVTGVNLVEVLPSPEVKPAFDDVARARDDRERMRAEAAQNVAGLVPAARTKAAALLAAAETYRQDTVNRANGEAARFAEMLAEYRRAPAVTRHRLYYETMEAVLAETRAVIVDGRSNEAFSLPLDKLVLPLPGRTEAAPPAKTAPAPVREVPK